jgi:hypothetical protein
MQEFLNVIRRLVYPAAALFLLWAGYRVIATPYISENSGKILAVYDGDSQIQNCNEDITPDKENQSEEALAGFCKAVKTASKNEPEVDLLNVHADVHDRIDGKSSGIYQQIASRVARGPVLGVISFLTSPDSPPVIRFCRTMQIPLLVALAANDNLMAPSEDTRGIVFGMIPTNGRQAINIADWLRQRVQPYQQVQPHQRLRVALFHEPNSFGEFLHRQLTHELEPELREKQILVYNFEVTERVEFADLMPQLWCGKIDIIAYLGFAPRALDLLNQLGSYKADLDQVPCDPRNRSRSFDKVTVLLSSGAYQDDLNDDEKYTFPFKVFAMLPTRPGRKQDANLAAANAPQDDVETDASEYGYDSYHLLERLATERFRIPSLQPIEHPKTGHEFRFDENGELRPAEKNKYHAYPLVSSSPGRRS